MKLTNKVALISGLGCLALVGTGFAAWVYNDESNQTAAATDTTVHAESATDKKAEIVLGADSGKAYSFKLDQADTAYHGKLVWADLDGDKTGDVMSFSATLKSAFTAADGVTDDFKRTDFNCYYTVAYSKDISAYVAESFGTDAELSTGHAWADATPIAYSLAWVSTKTVPTVADYTAMRKAVEGVTITVTFHADVK
jgi:hypothetical protein